MSNILRLRTTRKNRLRYRLRLKAQGRLRLSIFRSDQHIYAQVIDDKTGLTIVSASSLERIAREAGKKGSNIAGAKLVGKRLAEKAAAMGVKNVVFDRGAYLYHGRVKMLAESAREAGLCF